MAEEPSLRFVHASHQPVSLPWPLRRPPARRGRPLPPGATDNRALRDEGAAIVPTVFGELLDTLRVGAGLPPVHSVRDYAFTAHPWLATDPLLSPWQPTGLGVVQTGAWCAPDERPLPAELVEFLDDGPPPVHVGFGSTPLGAPEEVARAAVAAIRAQGRRAVVSRGWAELALADGRDDCLLVGEVNHQALFRRVAAVVHHGSAGTTMTDALAGVPQVVAQGADQPYWAGRVADLGIGAAHEGPAPAAGSLSAALRTALAPETRARAAEVAATVRTDGTTVAARLLLAGGGRTA
ncbi:glycosyltransferase [Streptomyces sp. NBC_00347]|uniref:glycosyltransferase n=1 Tax=Streptomyces sp. NBC_00347 TaxID=2975721 RepID=UPI002B1D8431|nr:glycosyltransferase [Streptomyces sp. NBC_00347]